MLSGAAWLSLHRLALIRGFLITRHGLSTDTLYALVIGTTATMWTICSIFNTSLDDEESFLARGAQAPLLVQILFAFWLLAWVDRSILQDPEFDSLRLWDLTIVNGAFDWINCIPRPVFRILCVVLTITIGMTSTAAIIRGSFVQGLLNFAGLTFFLLSGIGPNPYVRALHRYSADMLRISLPTSHHEGTSYILPSTGYGFDAVWTPKVLNEHKEADEQAMALFENMRSEKWSLKEPLERIRAIVAGYQRRTALSSDELQALARWVYLDPDVNNKTRKMRCNRVPGVHLIGRDLMYSLCHVEYLVFMGQGRLLLEYQAKLSSLRLMKRSGASPISEFPTEETVGFKPGLGGYKEAVEYVYRLFDEPLDNSAINFTGTEPPTFSSALSKKPASIDAYVAELWSACCEYSESTFTALYMFTTIWFMELGNCNGFHIFPLRAKTRKGDLVSQQIVWRQAWYSGVICQLISSSPLLFAAFITGYLG